MDSNTFGLLLIVVAMIAFGVRIWARNRPERRRWSQAAMVVNVVILVALGALLASYFLDPTID